MPLSLRSLPFPSFFNSLSWGPPSHRPPRVVSAFDLSTSRGIRWVRPPSPCAALPPGPRRRLTCNPSREGPPPHTGSQWRLGSAPPLLPRPERVWAWAAGLEPLALLLGFGRRTIRRPAAWPLGSHGLAGAEGERARRAACCSGGMARGRGAWGSARADRARPLLLAVPAAQPGWVSPFGALACDLHHLLSLRRPCLGSFMPGSLPHALRSELPLVCGPILLVVFTFTFVPCLLIRFLVIL